MTDGEGAEAPRNPGGFGGSNQSIKDRIEEEVERKSEVPLIANRDLLDPNTIVDSKRIVGREEQLDSIISHLRPALNGKRPANMLLYGPSGTGKSLIVNAVGSEIRDLCAEKGIRFGLISLNCQLVDTHNNAAHSLAQNTAELVGAEVNVPETGVSAKTKLERTFELIDDHFDIVLFVLDEIDLLKGASYSDEPGYSKLLYQLSRADVEGFIDGRCSVAALTNDPEFMERLDGRAESSYAPENINFADYDAHELRDILYHRQEAFVDGALTNDVIPLTAAFAARSHGDARKAINLLRNAGEVAEQSGAERVREEHVREAQDRVDVNRTKKLIQGLSTQKKTAFYACAAVLHFEAEEYAPSPAAHGVYSWVTDDMGIDEYQRETFNKYMKELEGYGLVTCQRRGRGRAKGMILEFELSKSPEAVMKALESERMILDVPTEELEAVVKAQMKEAHS